MCFNPTLLSLPSTHNLNTFAFRPFANCRHIKVKSPSQKNARQGNFLEFPFRSILLLPRISEQRCEVQTIVCSVLVWRPTYRGLLAAVIGSPYNISFIKGFFLPDRCGLNVHMISGIRLPTPTCMT